MFFQTLFYIFRDIKMRTFLVSFPKKSCIKWHCLPVDTACLIVIKVGFSLLLCSVEEILLLNVLCHQCKEFLL